MATNGYAKMSHCYVYTYIACGAGVKLGGPYRTQQALKG
jgi:hypothetical protein